MEEDIPFEVLKDVKPFGFDENGRQLVPGKYIATVKLGGNQIDELVISIFKDGKELVGYYDNRFLDMPARPLAHKYRDPDHEVPWDKIRNYFYNVKGSATKTGTIGKEDVDEFIKYTIACALMDTYYKKIVNQVKEAGKGDVEL